MAQMASLSSPNNVGKEDQIKVLRTGPLFEHNCGLDLLLKDVFRPYLPALIRNGYFRRWRHQYQHESGTSDIQDSYDRYKVNLDIQQFKPEEITVRVVGDYVVVNGKHEEREDDHGFVSRSFQRRYKFPEDVNVEAVASKLSLDGILSVEAPKKTVLPPRVRDIEIAHASAPAMKPDILEPQGSDSNCSKE